MRYTFDMPRNKAWQRLRRRAMIIRSVVVALVVIAAVVLILVLG
jgi:hypothetical protein